MLESGIKDEVSKTIVYQYFGSKLTKLGWRYNAITIQGGQKNVVSIYYSMYEMKEIPNYEITL